MRGLLNHNNGKTFHTIKRVITEDLKYFLFYKIVKASDYGLPQVRPRLFMVGFKDRNIKFEFPDNIPLKYDMSYVMGGEVPRKIGFTLRCGGRGSKIHDRRNWDSYLVDGKENQLNSRQGLLMQGFDKDFIFPVSETQAMKQLGNSVAVDTVRVVSNNIIKVLEEKIYLKKFSEQQNIFSYANFK